eukprot:gene13544-biopygen990
MNDGKLVRGGMASRGAMGARRAHILTLWQGGRRRQGRGEGTHHALSGRRMGARRAVRWAVRRRRRDDTYRCSTAILGVDVSSSPLLLPLPLGEDAAAALMPPRLPSAFVTLLPPQLPPPVPPPGPPRDPPARGVKEAVSCRRALPRGVGLRPAQCCPSRSYAANAGHPVSLQRPPLRGMAAVR